MSVVTVTGRTVLVRDEIRIGGALRRVVHVRRLHNGARLLLHTGELLVVLNAEEYEVYRSYPAPLPSRGGTR